MTTDPPRSDLRAAYDEWANAQDPPEGECSCGHPMDAHSGGMVLLHHDYHVVEALASAPDEGPYKRDDLRTRALKRIVMARDGRAEGLHIKRFSPAREADLLAYAASVPDEDILGWRDTGPAILRWIRTHQTFVSGVATGGNDETPVRLIPDAVVGSTFAEVIKNTGWRVELFWNEGGGWFTARLISRTDRDGHGAYPGGYLVPFESPIGASGDTPWEALANLSEAVLEWA